MDPEVNPTETTTATTTANTSPAANVTIPKEVVERLQAEVISAAKAEAEKRASEIVEVNNQRIRQAMGDVPEDDSSERVLQHLLKDPIGLLRSVSATSKQEAKEEWRAEEAERNRVERENRRATHTVLATRPDIHSNDAAMKIISSFWKSASPDLDPTEQLKDAVKQYDLLMEKNGAGDADKRIEAASSLSRSASTSSSEASKGAAIGERIANANTSWMERRKEEFKKKHGGQYPSLVRR